MFCKFKLVNKMVGSRRLPKYYSLVFSLYFLTPKHENTLGAVR